MSLGRQRFVTKGAVKFSDRRLGDGRFLLTPTPAFRNMFGYWYAFCARKFEMRVHELLLMGTHYHAEQTDTLGKNPKFKQLFHCKIAHEIKRMYGIKGPVWDTKSRGGVMDVVSVEAYVKTRHYMKTNPVEAGICANPEDWPGFFKAGDVFTVPEYALKKDASLPQTLTLPMAPCNAFEKDGYSGEELEALVKEGEQAAVDEVHWKRVREGKSYQRVKNALKMAPGLRKKRPAKKQRWWKRRGEAAAGRDATIGEKELKRGFTPRWVAVTKEAIELVKEKLKAFRAAYLKAYAAFQAGNTEVEFPYGTWKMVHVHGCKCAPP